MVLGRGLVGTSSENEKQEAICHQLQSRASLHVSFIRAISNKFSLSIVTGDIADYQSMGAEPAMELPLKKKRVRS
jgi:hypothetical protein